MFTYDYWIVFKVKYHNLSLLHCAPSLQVLGNLSLLSVHLEDPCVKVFSMSF